VKTVRAAREREPWPGRAQRERLRRAAALLRRRAGLPASRCDVVTVVDAPDGLVVRHHRSAF
jgi:hypothetical protein